MKPERGIVALGILVSWALSAPAATIVYTYTGTGSGTLDGVPFTAAAFTIVGNADTAAIATWGSIRSVDHTSTTIQIGGVGTYGFTTGLRTFATGQDVGLSRAGPSGADLYDCNASALSGYNLASSIGPVPASGTLLQWTPSAVYTSGGVLVFTSQTVAGTFQAAGSDPTVTSVIPSAGPTAGGTSVTITGTRFTGATAVTIGGTAVTSFSVASDTSITAVTPAGTAGTASVLVTTGGGTNPANTLYRYAPVPTVTSISPPAGPSAGGTNVTITGTGFTGATAVTIGGTAATSFSVASDTSISAVTPAGTAGAASVLVTTAGGTGTLTGGYTYTVAAIPAVPAASASGLLALGVLLAIGGAWVLHRSLCLARNRIVG